MGVPDLLHALRVQGFKLWADGDRLLVAPKERITDETRALIREHKAELLAALDPIPDPTAEPRRQRAELRALIDKLAEKTGFTEADKREALEVALRAPDEWLKYLPVLLERCASGVH